MIRRRLRYGLLAAALVILAGVLSGCGEQAALVGASWPGIATNEDLEYVYVAFAQGVYAVDPETGREVWTYPSEPDRSRTFFAEPAVAEDIVVVGDYEETLTALDPETGNALWDFEAARLIGGATIGDELVYAGTADGTVYAINRTNGSEVWSFQADQDIWAQPLLVENTLYVASLDKHVYAVDAQTGDVRWRFPEDGQSLSPAMGSIVGTPTYYEGLLIFGSFNNFVYALDVDTRTVEWQYETENWVWSSPAVDEATGLLVGADLDGNIFALDAETGQENWSIQVPGPIVGAPTIAEPQEGVTPVYVATGNQGSDARLYKLNLETGETLLPPASVEVELTSRFLFFATGTNIRTVPIYTSPVLEEDLVLIGSHEGTAPLYALDRETLLEVWAFEPVSS